MRDVPAILGGTPICAAGAWPAWPQWDDTERAGLIAALDEGGWWTGDGSRAQAFADDFARFHDASLGLPFTNGTHTLEAALAACGVGQGDEVIVPALTFVATATAVMAVNGEPALVDIDRPSLCIDPDAVEAAITDRTRAVIAVHVAGAACDLDRLVPMCREHGLALVEDCAHAHGSRWRGRGVGSFGAFGSFSMQRSKLMTAGEGGVLIGSDPELMDRAWSYWNCGRVKGGHGYGHPGYGSNLRMTEWQGAVLSAQLARFPDQHRRRQAAALSLNAELATIPGLTPQARDPRIDEQGNYCYVFHYDASRFSGLSLRGFEIALAAEGVPLDGCYPALHTLEMFRTNNFAPRSRDLGRDYSGVSLPESEGAARSTVWVEHRALLAEPEAVLDIVRACARIQRHAAAVDALGIAPEDPA